MRCVVRDADEADLGRIVEILNVAIVETTAVWSLDPVSLEQRRRWLAERRARRFPVLVAESEGDVVGFGSFGDFRAWEGYAQTVEHSIYVDARARRQGIGRALLAALIERAREAGKHVMVGGIEAENHASIALHERLGFVEVGRMPQVGRKFGRWLDLVFMQLLFADV